MAEEPWTVEDLAAGLLNGVMLGLLGGAFPAVFVWQAVRHWSDWTLDFSLGTVPDAGSLLGVTFFSLLFLRTGARLVRKNVTALRRPSASGLA